MAEVEAFDQFAAAIARESWQTFRREPVLFVIAGLVTVVCSVVSLGLLIGPLQVGFIELVRKVRAGEPVAVSVLFSRMDTLVSSSVAMLVAGLLCFIGLVMLVVPGLLVMFFFFWSLPAIAYEGLGGIDSLRRSAALTRANTMHTLALLFLVALAHAVGGLIMFGFVLTLPLCTIACALGYERLAAATPEAQLPA
ncbi:MAG TPA: hypothetical protein VI299_06420 [Polyangiales bacterium]